jgi:uncharacterized protein (TIGR04255 family)
MNVGIQFTFPVDQKIADSIEVVKAEFAVEFPAFQPLQTFTINLSLPQSSVVGPSMAPTIAGFNLTKLKTDGSPARVLRLMGNVLSVHFSEYTTWKEIGPQAISYIVRCLERIAILGYDPATSVLLRYIDRFTFDGMPQDANASTLFRADNKFVPSRILNAGYQWHANSGWFEPLGRASSVLNQLNVSSGMAQNAVSVTVDDLPPIFTQSQVNTSGL